jgi:flavin prenyltransferase
VFDDGIDCKVTMAKQRLIVGITGASGAAYGLAALKALRSEDIETHLVISRSGQITAAHELGLKFSELSALADVVYKIDDMAAAISSGSFKTLGMLVAPCSIRTLSEIAGGVTSSLLSRAADVVLKERRKLVLMVRETPLHLGHLRAMTQVTEMGAIVMPPVPAFYTRPSSLDDVVNHSVGRALDLFGLDLQFVRRWGEQVGIDR